MSFFIALKLILQFEGGYVNDPKDPGGPTNYGITQQVYNEWLNHKNYLLKSVSEITYREAAAIYKIQYWGPIKGDKLPSGLALCLFDFAVHSGPQKAIKTLQTILHVPVDGVMGIVTLRTINAAQEEDIIQELMIHRLQFLKKLKHWKTYQNGWTNRLKILEKESMKLASDKRYEINHEQKIEPIAKAKPKDLDPIKDNKIVIGGLGLSLTEITRLLHDFGLIINQQSITYCIITSFIVLSIVGYFIYNDFQRSKNS